MSNPRPDFTNILDTDFPPVNRDRVRPAVREVALLERTRCVEQDGAVVNTFTTLTSPTYDECEGVIDQAVEMVLVDLPDYLPESTYPRVKQAVILRAAFLVEMSFYREQIKESAASIWDTQYDKVIASIEIVTGGSGVGTRVDSIMGRSTMAEYDPDLPIPPPRVMPKMPFPIDGNPYSEGQQ